MRGRHLWSIAVGSAWAAWLLAVGVLGAAAPVAPEIYLAPLLPGGLGPVENITNNPGYDNQPAFLPNSKAILFASNRNGAETNIYRYDLKSRRVTELTRTEDSEYAPMPTPDGKGISAMRLETGGHERLWRFKIDGSTPVVVFEKVPSISGYAWTDRTHVALVVPDQRRGSAALAVADTETQTTTTVAPDVGRSLALQPKSTVLTFLARSAGKWRVKSFDRATREVTDLVAVPPGSEDLAWTPSGNLLMSHGTTIFEWRPGAAAWTHFVDLPPTTYTNVTRLAVSPDGRWLAFVGEPAK